MKMTRIIYVKDEHGKNVAIHNRPTQMDFPYRQDGNKLREIEEPQNVKVQIYVPSTKHTVKLDRPTFNRRVEETKAFLNRLFGGTTTTKGGGAWMEGNRLIQEPVAVVESYTTMSKYNRYDFRIIKWLLGKTKTWNQSAISYGYNDKLFFVSRKG
jgi:hypothetical protein